MRRGLRRDGRAAVAAWAAVWAAAAIAAAVAAAWAAADAIAGSESFTQNKKGSDGSDRSLFLLSFAAIFRLPYRRNACRCRREFSASRYRSNPFAPRTRGSLRRDPARADSPRRREKGLPPGAR